MSDSRLEFRIDGKLKAQFQSLAKKNRTTASQLLLEWIEKYVRGDSLILFDNGIESKNSLYGQPEA